MAVKISKDVTEKISNSWTSNLIAQDIVEMEINNAIILISDTPIAIICPERGFIAGSNYLVRDWKSCLNNNTFKSARYIQGTYIAGFNASKLNYYHWVFQALVNLMHFEQNYTENVSGILTFYESPFVKEYVNKLKNSILKIEANSIFVVQYLLWSNLLYGFVYCNNKYCIDILKTLSSTKKGHKRIYISRVDSKRRRVENEKECIEILKKYGFESYILSQMTVDEQINLFSSAGIIISSHGAGLTNIVFAPEETYVIELAPEDYQNSCFRCIADSGGLNYSVIVNPVQRDTNRHFSKMTIDIELLVESLEEILNADKNNHSNT